MSKKKDDLRATAEDMIDDSRRVAELEHEKLRLDAADPRVDEVAEEVEDLVAGMARKARAQKEIATDTATG